MRSTLDSAQRLPNFLFSCKYRPGWVWLLITLFVTKCSALRCIPAFGFRYSSTATLLLYLSLFSTFFFLLFFSHFYFPASGQAVVTGVVPSPPPVLTFNFFAHRVQQSNCSSIFHRVLLTHALALSASQFVHKKKSHRIYASMHSAGLELTN